MYSAPYGYPNVAAGGPPFNGGAPPPQNNPHLQPGPSPNQPQQMMYNTQQFPMAAQGAHFPAGSNPAMMGGAGPAGMMQNTAMHHMAANGPMAYQTPPYTGSPYGPAIPSSAAPQPQLPANYMMASPMASYQMNPNIPQQQPMMQRMHHPSQQNMSVSTPQRPFNPNQGTPNSSMPPQQPVQYPTSQQGHSTPQSQTPTNVQPTSASVATPQTPTFPSTGQPAQLNGTSAVTTPQSPGTESREKERFSLILEINQELLYESIAIVNSRSELKKVQTSTEAAGVKEGEMDLAEEEKLSNQDYAQCMRRLQTNLAYLAALADRKPSVQVPACPAYLMPPPLNLNLKLRIPPSTSDDPNEKPLDPSSDREERDKVMKDLYKKLQALFPGIDPRKEPPPASQMARTAPNQHPNQQGAIRAQNGTGSQGSSHGSPAGSAAGQPQSGPPQRTPHMAHASVPMQMQMQMQMKTQ